MKRLFLLSALVTLACSGEAAVSNLDPQDPEVEGPASPDAPEPSDPVADPRSPVGGHVEESGSVFDGSDEPAYVEQTALYTGLGDGDHWLVAAGDNLLFADTAGERLLEISRTSGKLSVVASEQPGVAWLSSDAGVGYWATQSDAGATLQFKDLRSGRAGSLAEGIQVPEGAVVGDGVVVWQDWASSGIVGVALDEPGRVVTLVADASAHAPAIADGFVYYASERDQGSIRRVALDADFQTQDSELVRGQLGQKISKFGNHSARDLQVVDGDIWFTSGVEGGSVWHIADEGTLENVGGTNLRARSLTVANGQAFWVTYSGSSDQRDGSLWAAPLRGGVETASEAQSIEPRLVAEHVGWVEHLVVAQGALFFTTSRVPGVFSVERILEASN
ncbi:MAG: hypothetical protein R3B07_11065 [Polyangiaceae bacterium]